MRVRRRRPPDRGVAIGLLGTMTVHAAVAGALFARPSERASAAPVYRVRLIAAPAPEPGRRPAPEVVERPAEQPPPAPPAARRPPKSTAAKAAPPPASTAAPKEAPPRGAARETPLPGERPSTGTAVANVEIPGVEFPFPEYLGRLVSEVYRRWQRPLSDQPLEAEILFFIHRDGSVSSLQFTKRSGNFTFDLEARGAVEAAAQARAFGPLPDDFPGDILPVTFFFTPRSGR